MISFRFPCSLLEHKDYELNCFSCCMFIHMPVHSKAECQNLHSAFPSAPVQIFWYQGTSRFGYQLTNGICLHHFLLALSLLCFLLTSMLAGTDASQISSSQDIGDSSALVFFKFSFLTLCIVWFCISPFIQHFLSVFRSLHKVQCMLEVSLKWLLSRKPSLYPFWNRWFPQLEFLSTTYKLLLSN